MPQLGKYSYPALSFEEAVNIVKKYSTELKGNAASQPALADLLGHNYPSGSFNAKLADLRKYGLLENRGLKLSDLGQKIAVPINEQEFRASCKEALLKIGLISDLYTKMGGNMIGTNFMPLLMDVTGANREDCKAQEVNISKLYKEAMSYFNREYSPKSDFMQSPEMSISVSQEYHMVNFENIYMKIPKEKSSINTAIKLLEMLKEKESKK